MVKAGNMVRDNDTTLVTLRQLTPIYVTFAIPEQSLAEVRRLNAEGQLTVNASIDAASAGGAANPSIPEREGHLVFIDNTVDATTGTVRLKAVFPNSDNALWPGEFVNVRLRLGLDKGSTLVPESSVQDGLDGKYVWLIKSGVASTESIRVLRTYRPPNGLEQAIIGSGIKPGDMVVTEGQLRLTAGAGVSILSTPGSRL
jgi:multidrug efflux system membrane fusion protein